MRLWALSLLVLSSAACSTTGGTPATSGAAAAPTKSAKVTETKADLRDLWLGHIVSIRNVAVATVDK
ncbi:MAG: hypothetical protein DCC63_10055, partial [Nitrospira sp.]